MLDLLARCGLKFTHSKEGVEVALAATNGDPEEFTSEAADLICRVLALLKQHGLNFADVTQQLRSRHRR